MLYSNINHIDTNHGVMGMSDSGVRGVCGVMSGSVRVADMSGCVRVADIVGGGVSVV